MVLPKNLQNKLLEEDNKDHNRLPTDKKLIVTIS